MVSYNQFIAGIVTYIDKEILINVHGWQKHAIGIAVGIIAKRSETLLDSKYANIAKSLGILDDNNNVDIDLLYEEVKKEVEKNGFILFDTGEMLFGQMKFNVNDIEKLNKEIRKVA